MQKCDQDIRPRPNCSVLEGFKLLEESILDLLCLVGRIMTPWQEKKEEYTRNAELSTSEEANKLFQWCPLLKRQ